LSRRGRSLPADASGFDTHRDPITSRFDHRRDRLKRRRQVLKKQVQTYLMLLAKHCCEECTDGDVFKAISS
jgi:hypothetical protein